MKYADVKEDDAYWEAVVDGGGQINELKPKAYKRFTPKPIEADNTLEAVLNMTIESLKQSRGLKNLSRSRLIIFNM